MKQMEDFRQMKVSFSEFLRIYRRFISNILLQSLRMIYTGRKEKSKKSDRENCKAFNVYLELLVKQCKDESRRITKIISISIIFYINFLNFPSSVYIPL